ncbi:MAG: cation transporter [Ruminococcus sp.]|nr:cation transporter [Ruminococcus sp.]
MPPPAVLYSFLLEVCPLNRDKVIVRTSIIGIIANIALAGFKAFVGMLTGSIAIILDAVNNLSDVLSSAITIVGTKLAGKKPDKKHPYGHGRGEYMTAIVIAAIVLYAGITALIEAIKKIIAPRTPDYPVTSFIILAAAVVVKLLLGTYVKRTGEKVNSDSLVASGKDALLDSVISTSTIVAAVIFVTTGVSLEAWLAAIIALVIIKAGIEMMNESFSEILGERVDKEYSKEIKNTITSFPQVSGAYDLVLHNYGPDTMIGSVHIEVPDTMTAAELDVLEREISGKVLTDHGVILAGISVYSVNTKDDNAAKILEDVRKTVMSHTGILQIHGFYYSEEFRTITFDMIIDFAYPDREGLYRTIFDEIQSKYPEFGISITLDVDVSD